MPFLLYVAIFAASLSGILLELNWLVATPPQPTWAVRVASATVQPMPAPPQPKPAAPQAVLTPVNPTPLAAPAQNSGVAVPAAQNPRRQPAADSGAGQCDIHACAAAYRSFRESDCTYNPSFGPRRLCTKGHAPAEAAAPTVSDAMPPIANPEPDADKQSHAQCNVDACGAAYHSFTASDCTYQPTSGPRRLCAK